MTKRQRNVHKGRIFRFSWGIFFYRTPKGDIWMRYKTSLMMAAMLSSATITAFASEGPCDIYARAKTPCVAAHSLTRALFGNYSGNLYQVRRADGEVKDVPVEKMGGYVKSSVQDDFCAGTNCTISIIYDQTSYKTTCINRHLYFG